MDDPQWMTDCDLAKARTDRPIKVTVDWLVFLLSRVQGDVARGMIAMLWKKGEGPYDPVIRADLDRLMGVKKDDA